MNEVVPALNPPPTGKCVPGIAQSLTLSALYFAIYIAVTLALQVAHVSLGMFSSLLIIQVISWPLILWVGLRWSRVSFRQACPLTRFPVRIVPALLIASFGATILLLSIAGLIPMPEAIKKEVTEGITGGSKLCLFFSLVLAAPLGEELFFRGWILRGYLGRYSARKAVWASAILFALFHLNPWQAVVALPLGLGFAWLFLRTGSLIPGILGHATVNFSTNFLLSPLAHALGYDDDAKKALDHLPTSMLALGSAMAIIGGLIGGLILWRQLAGFSPLSKQPRNERDAA
jgi:membrane protease YdiL (CAAX protease family)